MAGGWKEDEWSARFKTDPDLTGGACSVAYKLKKPLVAAVEGTAVAGGTEILEGLTSASPGRARSSAWPRRVGVCFRSAGRQCGLRRQIPYTLAMEMLLTGQHLAAEEAFGSGSSGGSFRMGRRSSEARKVAEQIAGNGPLAVQAIKRSVIETEGLPKKTPFPTPSQSAPSKNRGDKPPGLHQGRGNAGAGILPICLLPRRNHLTALRADRRRSLSV